MVFFLTTLLYLQEISSALLTSNPELCSGDSFKLKEMKKCHLHLNCEDMSDVTIVESLGSGAVKDVFLSKWQNIYVALSVPASKFFLEDFLSGVKALKVLNPNKHIVQFVGYCDKDYRLLTEYHPNGNAADFFSKSPMKSYNVVQGLNFCHQYSLILTHLHHGLKRARVFCDSNTLEKLLSQLLVTSDLTLVLNDVDAVPEVVNDSGIKCGGRQLSGTFIAPEQLWTGSEKFSDFLKTGYDEKTDIWKAATVCEYFLSISKDEVLVRYRLFDLHAKCKSLDPKKRPSSTDLEKEYKNVLKEYIDHSEL